MKVFLGILLYLICSECRIEDSPIKTIPYNVLGRGQTNYTCKVPEPIVIKDLTDYTNFYLEHYSKYPEPTDYDFTKNMMVVMFVSTMRNDFEIEDVFEERLFGFGVVASYASVFP